MEKSSVSIMTSGFSFFAACIGVSFVAKMDLIKSLVILLARGALISVVSILLVLPSLLIFCHKFIEKRQRIGQNQTWKRKENKYEFKSYSKK